MKKGLKFLACALSVLMCTTTLFSLVGCGKKIEGSGFADDPKVPNIYYYYYDGDGKKDWLFNAATDFNKTIDNYEIIPFASLNEDYSAVLASCGGDATIFQMTSSGIDTLIEEGYITDLSDILSKDVDGNGVTLAEKFNNLESLKALYSSRYTKGLYGVPTGISPLHLIFDFDLFKSQGWLMYQKGENGAPLRDDEGNLVLTTGHDGIAGTYDDGQPVTIEEWDEMIERIKVATNTKPFIYTTKYPFYIEPLVDALIAQYGGYDEYVSIMSGYGAYTDANGQKIDVPIESGYDMYKSPSVLKALEFMKKYLISKDNVHEQCWDTVGFTHDDAKKLFVTGFLDEVQQAAMLVEWPSFESSIDYYCDHLEERGYEGRGYGERDFRFMLLPRLGNENISYLAAQGVGAVVVAAESDEEKVRIAKDFVAFTLKDEYLQQYTLDNGSVRPLKFELTQEQKDSLTPMIRNSVEVMQDTEHVKILSPLDTAAKDPGKNGLYEFKGGGYPYTASFDSGNISRVLTALMRYTPEEYFNGIYKYKKVTCWGVR